MPTMDPIDLSPADLTIVLHILRRYVPEREVVAFGSRAKWTTRPGSDLDLAVLGETPLSAEVIAAMKDAFDESSLTFAVDIVDWAAAKESFREIIRRDQILVKPAEPLASRDDWHELTIGDVADVFDGPHATPPKVDAGPIFLGISNLVNGRLDLSEVEHISLEDYERWTKRVTPRADDVVFSYETRLGEAALIPEGLKCCLGRRMGLLRAKPDRIDPRFLLYAFLGPDFQNTIRSRTIHGSTVDRIPLVDFPRFPIRIPKRLSDQRRIAEILGAIDDKIELNRRMNETLEAIARSAFGEWTEHATVSVRVADVAELNARQLRRDDAIDVIEYVEISEVHKGEIRHTTRYARGNEPSRAKRRLHHGDTVLSTVRPDRQAYFLALNPPASLVVSTGFAVVSPTRVPWSYLHIALTQPRVFAELGHLADGGAYPAVPPEVIASMEIPRIESVQLGRFHDVVAPLLCKQEENRRESRILSQIRDTLLPKLLSGEVPVVAAEKELAAHV